jgi:hypothetical protein
MILPVLYNCLYYQFILILTMSSFIQLSIPIYYSTNNITIFYDQALEYIRHANLIE